MGYVKGQSGNPSGRPKGTTSKELRSLRHCAPELVELIKQQAFSGCLQSQKLIIDRILPSLKPVELCIKLPGFPNGASPAQQARYLLQATAAGVLSQAQGAGLIKCLADTMSIVEIDEIEQRLAQLEDTLLPKTP